MAKLGFFMQQKNDFNFSGKMLVTGGGGFIGSHFVRKALELSNDLEICVIDHLGYSSNKKNYEEFLDSKQFIFSCFDLNDARKTEITVRDFKPNYIVNFAAESHVDRSIDNPVNFVQNNVNSVLSLLEASRKYWTALPEKSDCSNPNKNIFRHIQISSDEVYGSLSQTDPPFSENSPYKPNSPYSASKAAGDHLTRAWFNTYGLPVIITCCSNNYGPNQHPEKLIPLIVMNALEGLPLPIYGDGKQIRDWIHVDDHINGILSAIAKGKIGETYNFGGNCELTNITLVKKICNILDELHPRNMRPDSVSSESYSTLIRHVKDRPGHDTRYAVDFDKAYSQLEWEPLTNIVEALYRTVKWYVDNQIWVSSFGSEARARRGQSW